jgi:hypothetical protein
MALFHIRILAVILLSTAITVAARPKAWYIFFRSSAGILGSNLIQGMSVCISVYCVFVLFSVYVADLRWPDHSSKESYRLCKEDYETEKKIRAQQRAVESLTNEMKLLSTFLFREVSSNLGSEQRQHALLSSLPLLRISVLSWSCQSWNCHEGSLRDRRGLV